MTTCCRSNPAAHDRSAAISRTTLRETASVRGNNQDQAVSFLLMQLMAFQRLGRGTDESCDCAHGGSNFAGAEGNFAGGVRPLRGPEKNGASPTLEMVSAATSRLRGNAYRGSGAAGVPQNAIVAEGKPNGHWRADVARRSEPFTARTVLRESDERERRVPTDPIRFL